MRAAKVGGVHGARSMSTNWKQAWTLAVSGQEMLRRVNHDWVESIQCAGTEKSMGFLADVLSCLCVGKTHCDGKRAGIRCGGFPWGSTIGRIVALLGRRLDGRLRGSFF